MPCDTWTLNFVLKQSKRDSVFGGDPGGGVESETGFCEIPFLKMKASLVKQPTGFPRSDLLNLAVEAARSSLVRSLSGNSGTFPATASPKLK